MDFFSWCIFVAGFSTAIATLGCGLGQGIGVYKAVEGISRNPGAGTKIMVSMAIGLAFIEALAIYVFVVAMITLMANPFTQLIVNKP
ncbi:MAG: ATP synthase F0 subunit C [Deltaproteobacteria bacterium]|nr:ATP synthase F0 subunit C [Deltaproteobacteria bacterium]